MRLTNLTLVVAAAAPVLCVAVQPRTIVAQVPVILGAQDVATSSYPQEPVINGTIAATAKSSTAELVDSSESSSTKTAAAAAELPAPALDKSIFSLIVFGIAGLCLL